MIDTHAHIYLNDFETDRSTMIERSRAAGVERIYMPNIDRSSVEQMLGMEEQYPGYCVATMGLHPCSVDGNVHQSLYEVEQWLMKRKFAAIGEIGTDRHWDTTYWEQQKEAFCVQVTWAKQYHIPVIIHCRESLDQTIELVASLHDGRLTGVFHCFTGNEEQARRIVNLGFYLGIGGVITFKKAGLGSVLKDISVDHLVLETDSPYLAPAPHRGKRNEPSYLNLIAEKIAADKNMSVPDVISATTHNALTLFDPISLQPHAPE